MDGCRERRGRGEGMMIWMEGGGWIDGGWIKEGVREKGRMEEWMDDGGTGTGMEDRGGEGREG